MQITVSKYSVISPAKHLIFRDMGEEVAILNPKFKTPYVLSGAGVIIWNLIQKFKTINEILDTLLEKYEVDLSQCEHDLLVFLQELADEELIEVTVMEQPNLREVSSA